MINLLMVPGMVARFESSSRSLEGILAEADRVSPLNNGSWVKEGRTRKVKVNGKTHLEDQYIPDGSIIMLLQKIKGNDNNNNSISILRILELQENVNEVFANFWRYERNHRMSQAMEALETALEPDSELKSNISTLLNIAESDEEKQLLALLKGALEPVVFDPDDEIEDEPEEEPEEEEEEEPEEEPEEEEEEEPEEEPEEEEEEEEEPEEEEIDEYAVYSETEKWINFLKSDEFRKMALAIVRAVY